MDCRLDWMKTQLPKLKQKILTYIFLITVQVVAVIMLRTLGFQQSGNILMEIACYALAFSPLLVVAVLLFRKGWQFQLSTLMIAVAMAAIFLYASLVPILKIRDEHNVRLRLVSLGAEVDRGIDWTEYYDDLGLQSTHSVISSSAWAPFWLAPISRHYLRHPADCEITQINLYSDEQINIFCESPQRFASLRVIAVASNVSETGLGKLADALSDIPSLKAVCLHDVETPEGFFKSLKNVRTIHLWAQGSFVGRQIELDDLQDIASLPNLETLMILGYGVSDSETKALVSGTNLNRLILRDSFISVSASEIERLEQIGISMR